MEFRRAALAKRQATDDLRTPLRLTRPRSWLLLLVLIAILGAGITWAVVGEVPRRIDAVGVLSPNRGSFTVQTPSGGQVAEVLVARGDTVRKGDPVARLDTGAETFRINAVTTGRVAQVLAEVGQFVPPGGTLAIVERTGRPGDRLVAVLYVPESGGVPIAPGAIVDVKVDSAPSAAFGVLLGRVTSIGEVGETSKQIADFLADDLRAEAIGRQGLSRKVIVDLLNDANTPSGYAWSNRSGPPFRLDSRTGVVGAIEQPSLRPIQWLLPA